MRTVSKLLRDSAVAGLIAMAAAPGALIALSGTAAMAEGKGDRADKAIAEAQGKVDMAAKLPVHGNVADMQAQASAALRDAREAQASGHKEAAINQAMKASEIADRAMAEARTAQADVNASHAADVQAAQQAAMAANDRAAAAEQTAQAAQADAAAARATPPIVVAQAPQPAPTTTEVTTSTSTTAARPAATRHVVKKTVTRRPATAAAATKTTTTVTTRN